MLLISINDFFSVGFYFILSIIIFIILLPFFILGGDILYTVIFSIFDFIIHLPKGINKSIERLKKDWQSTYLLEWIKKYKNHKSNKN